MLPGGKLQAGLSGRFLEYAFGRCIRVDGLTKARPPKDALRAHIETPHRLKQSFARTALTIELLLDKSMHDCNRCN